MVWRACAFERAGKGRGWLFQVTADEKREVEMSWLVGGPMITAVAAEKRPGTIVFSPTLELCCSRTSPIPSYFTRLHSRRATR